MRIILNNSTNIQKMISQPSPQIIGNKKNTTNDVENRVPGSGRAQKCDGHQPVNDIPILVLLIILSATATFNDLIIWCFNDTFNNISAISWRQVSVVEEAGVPGEKH